jgi:hypothetical protein
MRERFLPRKVTRVLRRPSQARPAHFSRDVLPYFLPLALLRISVPRTPPAFAVWESLPANCAARASSLPCRASASRCSPAGAASAARLRLILTALSMAPSCTGATSRGGPALPACWASDDPIMPSFLPRAYHMLRICVDDSTSSRKPRGRPVQPCAAPHDCAFCGPRARPRGHRTASAQGT